MRSVVKTLAAVAASATSIAALTTLGAAGVVPQNGALATANGIANAQTTAGAGFLVLNGSLVSAGVGYFSTPSRLNFQSAGNLSGINFTIVGLAAQGPDTTGSNGGPVTEVIAGPNANIVISQNIFLRIFSIAVSAAVGSNVTAYGTATLANASQVSLTSTNNLGAVNVTLYGFNANGQPITEVMAGPNNNTVNSVNYWNAVTQISTSAAITAMSVGNSGLSATAWIPVDYLQASFNVGIAVVITGGPPNYTVQQTSDDVFASQPFPTPTAFSTAVSALTGASTNQTANLTNPCKAVRNLINSGTGSATLTVTQGMFP